MDRGQWMAAHRATRTEQLLVVVESTSLQQDTLCIQPTFANALTSNRLGAFVNVMNRRKELLHCERQNLQPPNVLLFNVQNSMYLFKESSATNDEGTN